MARHRKRSARPGERVGAVIVRGDEPFLTYADIAWAVLLLALVWFVHRRTLIPMFSPDDLQLLEFARGIREWPDEVWRVLSRRWFWTFGVAWLGVDPAPWHLLLLAFHGAATVAAVMLVRAHGGSRAIAFASAAWFGTHRMVTDVLLQISCVSEVLSALLTFVAIVLALRAAKRAGIAATWLAALLAKESVALVPLASWIATRRRSLLILGASGFAFGVLLLAVGQVPGGAAYRWGLGEHIAHNLFAYAGTALDPWSPTTDPAGGQSEGFGCVALIVLALLAWASWSRTRLPATGLTGFLLSLGPTLLLRDARYAHYAYAAQLFMGLTLASLVCLGVGFVVDRVPRLPRYLQQTAATGFVAMLVVLQVTSTMQANKRRYEDWIPELQLPRDALLRKLVVISNALGSLEQSIGPEPCRLLILWPPSSGYAVGTRSGVTLEPPSGTRPAPILDSVLDRGLGLRAIFPQIRDVRMTDTWNPAFRGWLLATTLVNGQLIVLGSDEESHRRLAALWQDWGFDREASDHMARVAVDDGRRVLDGERRTNASTMTAPVR